MGDGRVVRDLLLQHMLDGGIGDRVLEFGRRDREGAGMLAMADGPSRHAVFGQLIDEWAGQNEIEELVDLGRHCALGRLLPGRPPEEGEDFHRAKSLSVNKAVHYFSVREVYAEGESDGEGKA